MMKTCYAVELSNGHVSCNSLSATNLVLYNIITVHTTLSTNCVVYI
jgi:hypothetical protein